MMTSWCNCWFVCCDGRIGDVEGVLVSVGVTTLDVSPFVAAQGETEEVHLLTVSIYLFFGVEFLFSDLDSVCLRVNLNNFQYRLSRCTRETYSDALVGTFLSGSVWSNRSQLTCMEYEASSSLEYNPTPTKGRETASGSTESRKRPLVLQEVRIEPLTSVSKD
ncbi:hypothetical protein Tco_0239653 [Tanacetum coccineum]